jgi:hypothetical protein
MQLKKIIKLTIKYWFEHYKLFVNQPEYFNLQHIKQGIKFFRLWLQSLEDNRNPLDDEQPWITYSAREFLEQILHQEMKVFEYGIGGSTIFFLNRVHELVSVEHDPKWFNLVCEKMKKYKFNHWESYLLEPEYNEFVLVNDPSDPDSYVSSDETFKNKSFRNYVTVIENYPSQIFDLIMIDGRARPSCFKHSLDKVKQGGWIVLDNSDRDEYHFIYETLNNDHWQKYEFYGLGPYGLSFWKTSIWKKII